MSQLSRPLFARLLKDLAELQEAPYPGVAVFTDDADIRSLCLVLTPPSGPWKDLSLHFDVHLPQNWLEQDYGGSVFIGDYLVDRYSTEADLSKAMFGGICCQRLYGACGCSEATHDQQLALEAQWRANNAPEVNIAIYEEGAVTHTTKVVSAGSRLHRFSKVNPRWQSTYTFVSKWQCKKCPYGSPALPAHRGKLTQCHTTNFHKHATSIPPPVCVLGILSDDVLLEIAAFLPSESLILFSKAYPHFRTLITSTRLLLQRELRCFFLRKPLHDSILGIGIAFDPNPRTLSSDFDWLSQQAFDQYGIRASIEKRAFKYFLPLAFSRPHFERAREDIWIRLQIIDKAVRDAEAAIIRRTGRATARRVVPHTKAHQVVEVVYKMMNNIVVSLMKSCDDVLNASGQPKNTNSTPTLLHASEKAVISYCHLFHLLLCLARTTPEILRDATNRLQRFIQVPESRTKTHLADIGELIVLVTLVFARPTVAGGTPVTWQALNGPFLEEAITRNSPELEVLEDGKSHYRLATTFLRSRTSLRLVMFQIAFLEVFVSTYAAKLTRLDDSYGFPEPEIPERMVREVRAIYGVSTWPDFFERVKYEKGKAFGAEKMSALLREAVNASAKRGYHVPKLQKQALAQQRQSLERKWLDEKRSI
ncbi:hypothetical protein H0H81_003259 [Sphagnurus paluster]|uniref:F-box domain-containing protein n=1 Tax=Sphagnurus paluster TaxID=117069 RepID=A0A9P7GP66_9AGAR|nr:hypothetical protein H0H81_003259 [Sphagnurus paluster]